MDGKGGAEELMGKLLNDPSLLSSLAAPPSPKTQGLSCRHTTRTQEPHHGRSPSQFGIALAGVTFEGSDLASLLQKEFKPKSDEAKSAVEQAVQTLAQQALSQTQLIGSDVVKSIEAMIAAIDKKLSEQINQILHHADCRSSKAPGAACTTWSTTPKPTNSSRSGS
jgi:hypothetical protein